MRVVLSTIRWWGGVAVSMNITRTKVNETALRIAVGTIKTTLTDREGSGTVSGDFKWLYK